MSEGGIERESNRVPPLNLTEEEITALRTVLQAHMDMGSDDPAINSLKEKADSAHRSVYTGTDR